MSVGRGSHWVLSPPRRPPFPFTDSHCRAERGLERERDLVAVARGKLGREKKEGEISPSFRRPRPLVLAFLSL